eukprot:PhM_4_TR15589/c0_g1_i1/m.96493
MKIWIREAAHDISQALKVVVPDGSDISDVLCVIPTYFNLGHDVKPSDIELRTQSGARLDNRSKVTEQTDVLVVSLIRRTPLVPSGREGVKMNPSHSPSPHRRGSPRFFGASPASGDDIVDGRNNEVCTAFQPSWNVPDACANCHKHKSMHSTTTTMVTPSRAKSPAVAGRHRSSTPRRAGSTTTPLRRPANGSNSSSSATKNKPWEEAHNNDAFTGLCTFRPVWGNQNLCAACGRTKLLHQNVRPVVGEKVPTHKSPMTSRSPGPSTSSRERPNQATTPLRRALWDPLTRRSAPKRRLNPHFVVCLPRVTLFLHGKDVVGLAAATKQFYLGLRPVLRIRRGVARRWDRANVERDVFRSVIAEITPDQFELCFLKHQDRELATYVLRGLCLLLFGVADETMLSLECAHLIQLVRLEGVYKLANINVEGISAHALEALVYLISLTPTRELDLPLPHEHISQRDTQYDLVHIAYRYLLKVVEVERQRQRILGCNNSSTPVKSKNKLRTAFGIDDNDALPLEPTNIPATTPYVLSLHVKHSLHVDPTAAATEQTAPQPAVEEAPPAPVAATET